MAKKGTTFRTSKGVVVSVAYPDIYIQPGFVLPEDVTSPAEMREALREELSGARFARYPVLLYDDFEAANFKWGLDGGAGYVRRSVDVARNGEACMELGTAPTINDQSQCHNHFMSFKGRTSVEFWFCGTRKAPPYLYGEQPDFSEFYFLFIDFFPDKELDGTNTVACGIKYLPPTRTFEVYNGTPAVWTTIWTSDRGLWAPVEEWKTNINYQRWGIEAYQVWHLIKLTANFTTRKYESVRIDDKLIDLSGYTIPFTVVSEAANGLLRFYIRTPENAVKRVFIDDVLVEALI